MSSGMRTIERKIARAHYERFCRLWRRDLRLGGLYGMPRSPKRPRFNQWYEMHLRDLSMMEKSAPADVIEHLGLDPWGGMASYEPDVRQPEAESIPQYVKSACDMIGEVPEPRGVYTVPITNTEDEK